MLEKYYDALYWQADGLPSSTWHQQWLYMEDDRANGQYRCLRDWIQPFADLNVLEVGAAKAFFSRLLKEKHRGKVHLNVVEPGNGREPYYAGTGISLLARYFPFESSKRFHYVHTSHWFEHISDVNNALRKIKSLLAPNGFLFIEVPNCNDDYYSVDRADRPHIHS